MPISRDLLDRLSVAVAGILLVGLVVGSWVPSSCPLLKKALMGCPAGTLAPRSAADLELSRIGHETIEAQAAFFTAQAEEQRGRTQVQFYYQSDANQVASLAFKKGDFYQVIGLVSHPLLTDLTWNSISSPDVRLYQRELRVETLDGASASTYSPSVLAADQAAARFLGLRAGQYRQLEDLTSLEGIDAILTTFAPASKDGSWRQYRHSFDLSDATANADGKLQGQLLLPGIEGHSPFQIGTVHVDYAIAERPASDETGTKQVLQ